MAVKTGEKCKKIDASEARRLERIVKGFSNHWRIRTLALLAEEPELNVHEITKRLKGNFKTISVHVRWLARTGLIMKRYEGRSVRHKITERGKLVLRFLGMLAL